MGIIEGPCGYSNRQVGTQGKLVFRETLGKSGPVGPRIGVFGHPAALRCQSQGPSAGMQPHEYPHGPSIIRMWSQTLVPTVYLKTSFPRIPNYHAGYPNGPSISLKGRTPVPGPSL